MAKVQALFLILFGVFVSCIEFVPERIIEEYINPKYVCYYRAVVRRAGRRLPYVINSELCLLYTMANNVSIKFLFFEYLHNEYRQSFIEINFEGCEGMLKNVYIGPFMRLYGMVCPFPAGNYTYANMTFLNIPEIDNLPYKWPFEKGKVTVTVVTIPKKEMISKGDVFFSIIQSNKKKTVS